MGYHGTSIVLGTKLRDNDPRANGNIVVVTGFEYENGAPVRVTYQSARRKSKVRIDRIHNDGKTRQTGYNIVL
jgi:hypothetical protein